MRSLMKLRCAFITDYKLISRQAKRKECLKQTNKLDRRKFLDAALLYCLIYLFKRHCQTWICQLMKMESPSMVKAWVKPLWDKQAAACTAYCYRLRHLAIKQTRLASTCVAATMSAQQLHNFKLLSTSRSPQCTRG